MAGRNRVHEEPRTGSLLWRCVLWPPSSQLMGATMWSALQWPWHSSKASISTSLQGNRIKTLLVNWSRHFLDLYITCCKRGPREMLVIFWASMVPVLLDQYVCVCVGGGGSFWTCNILQRMVAYKIMSQTCLPCITGDCQKVWGTGIFVGLIKGCWLQDF